MLYRIIVRPHTRPGVFEARLEGRPGILCISRTPFLRSARQLLNEGASPDAVIVMRHAGADHDALRSTIGLAASLQVTERHDRPPQFEPYSDPPSVRLASPVASEPKEASQ